MSRSHEVKCNVRCTVCVPFAVSDNNSNIYLNLCPIYMARNISNIRMKPQRTRYLYGLDVRERVYDFVAGVERHG